MWYQDLWTHGKLNGIFIPNPESFAKDTPMGTEWATLYRHRHWERPKMKALLHRFLNTQNMFPKEIPELQQIVAASRGDGYEALHNIMRLEHPVLNETPVELTIPAQTSSMTFGQHIQNVIVFVERERLRGRSYTKWEQSNLALRRLHTKYEGRMRERSERTYGHVHDRADNIPYCLQLPNLGTTLHNWAADMNIDINPTKEKIRQQTEQDDFIHALRQDRSKMKCSSCFRQGHEDHECNMTAKFVHMREHLKKNPSLEKKILADKERYMTERARPRLRKPKVEKTHAIAEEGDDSTTSDEDEIVQEEEDDFSTSQVNSLRTLNTE